ncbi:hypothetical protein BDQ17DRAFT_1357130 [Cyathus striatus]|nr:hypothetical protein BDQ17DRAFT_1357130 [Cyathus striatus]
MLLIYILGLIILSNLLVSPQLTMAFSLDLVTFTVIFTFLLWSRLYLQINLRKYNTLAVICILNFILIHVAFTSY